MCVLFVFVFVFVCVKKQINNNKNKTKSWMTVLKLQDGQKTMKEYI